VSEARAPLALPDAVLFDLDGTLIDSAPDIADAINEVLAAEGLAPLTLSEVGGMIGHGVAALVHRAFAARGRPLEGAEHERLTEAMMAAYVPRATAKTLLLPGAAEAVRFFAMRGVSVGVVTNKPKSVTDLILRRFGLAETVGVVIGGDSGLPRKPDPAMLLAALDWLGATPERAAMIGDSAIDAAAARNAGVAVLIVEGGYAGVAPLAREDADLFLNSLHEVPALFSGDSASPV